MIKLRYQHLFHEKFIMALSALKMTRFRDFRAPRNVIKICKAIDSEITVARKLYDKEFDDLFAKLDNGERIVAQGDARNIAPFKIVEGKEDEYKKKFTEFLNTEFEIECDKVNGDMILEAKYTPTMLAILEDIFMSDDEMRGISVSP